MKKESPSTDSTINTLNYSHSTIPSVYTCSAGTANSSFLYPDVQSTSIQLTASNGEIINLFIDDNDGLLKCSGKIDEETITPFINLFNQRLIEDSNIPVKLELLLIDAVGLLKKSGAVKTSQGKKLLRKFKSYLLGE
jgi:hypothetical protein